MDELSAERVRALRLRAQGLQPRLPRKQLVEAVRAVVGIQAQLTAAMQLALRARIEGLTLTDIEAAIGEDKTLARSWLMRGTLHLVASDDLRWMNALLAPSFIAKGKGRRAQLGLDAETSARGLKAIRAILKQKAPLTRGEIVERLIDHDVKLERRSQAPIHMIGLAALEGILCLGPDTPKGESTYVLVDDWLMPNKPLPREKALAELAYRYLEGYAPASLKDFAAWSGLTLTEAKQAWRLLQAEEKLVEVQVGDQTLWLPQSAAKSMGKPAPSVRLLPAFDAYLLGYADRELLVTSKYQKQVYHGGQTVPVVLVDGAAAGVWRYQKQGKRLRIIVHPFEPFDSQTEHGIAEEADDIGRFWESKVALSYTAEPL
jgi:hypothetical protein